MLWGPVSVLILWNSDGHLDNSFFLWNFSKPLWVYNWNKRQHEINHIFLANFCSLCNESQQTNLCVKIVSREFTINAAFWPKLYRTYLFNNVTHRCGVWSRRVLDWWPLADTFLHPVAILTSVMFPLFKLLFRVAEQRCIKLTRDSRLYRNVRYSNLIVLRRKYFVFSKQFTSGNWYRIVTINVIV